MFIVSVNVQFVFKIGLENSVCLLFNYVCLRFIVCGRIIIYYNQVNMNIGGNIMNIMNNYDIML